MRYQAAPLPDGPQLERIVALANPGNDGMAAMVGPAGFEPATKPL